MSLVAWDKVQSANSRATEDFAKSITAGEFDSKVSWSVATSSRGCMLFYLGPEVQGLGFPSLELATKHSEPVAVLICCCKSAGFRPAVHIHMLESKFIGIYVRYFGPWTSISAYTISLNPHGHGCKSSPLGIMGPMFWLLCGLAKKGPVWNRLIEVVVPLAAGRDELFGEVACADLRRHLHCTCCSCSLALPRGSKVVASG